MVSTVTVRGQTAIPVVIRRKYNIKPKTHIEWIDDGHSISIVPIPKDSIREARGRYKNSGLLKELLKSRQEEKGIG